MAILATMGPTGTHSEAAAKKFAVTSGCSRPTLIFGPVDRCLSLVENGRAHFAVLPAENMVDGLIGATYDSLIEHSRGVHVIDEVHLRIEHVLAVRSQIPLSDITRVYSHPSALNQCSRSLHKTVPQAEIIPVGSTAEAAARVANGDKAFGEAAVCSSEAALERGLLVLQTDFGDYQNNQTRFFVCAAATHHNTVPTGHDHTLLAVRFGFNQPGQLYRVAKAFALQGVDLTSVHSRPYKIRPQEYVLLFELIGHQTVPPIVRALAEIDEQVAATGGWQRVLGSFPRRGIS